MHPTAAKKAHFQVGKANYDATAHPDKVTTQTERAELSNIPQPINISPMTYSPVFLSVRVQYSLMQGT